MGGWKDSTGANFWYWLVLLVVLACLSPWGIVAWLGVVLTAAAFKEGPK